MEVLDRASALLCPPSLLLFFIHDVPVPVFGIFGLAVKSQEGFPVYSIVLRFLVSRNLKNDSMNQSLSNL